MMGGIVALRELALPAFESSQPWLAGDSQRMVADRNSAK